MPARAIIKSPYAWVWPILVSIVISGVGWISTAATRDAKLGELETRVTKDEARYEREVVPRVEHDYREKASELRLQKFDERLDKMQATLEEIAKELRTSNETQHRR